MIIFINGAINSGKSTIAKMVSQRIEKSAVLEIDNLSEFIQWMPIDEKVPINLENALAVIKNFTRRNLNVIIPYPLSQKNYDYLMDGLKDIDDKIFVFTLNPEIEVVLKNRGERELDDWERKRIQYHYAKGINNPKFGIIIDNTNLALEETVNVITKELGI